MMFDEEINKDEIENLSIANFLAITNKAYNLYLNQEIEDLDISTEQIPFIMELDRNETISKKDLAKYLLLNDRNTARGLIELYKAGIIDKKPLKNEVSDEKGDSIKGDTIKEDNINDDRFGDGGNSRNSRNIENGRNDGRYGPYDFNHDLEISLTPYGKKLALKIKEIDVKWEELIYKNLEGSDKDEIMKNVKNLAISSLKTNKDADISTSDVEVSKARKMLSKMLSRIFSLQDYRSQRSCHTDVEGHDFDDFNMEIIAHLYPERFREINSDHIKHMAYFKARRFSKIRPFFR